MNVSFDQMTAVHPTGLKLVAHPSQIPGMCYGCDIWSREVWHRYPCMACQPSDRKDNRFIVWKEAT